MIPALNTHSFFNHIIYSPTELTILLTNTLRASGYFKRVEQSRHRTHYPHTFSNPNIFLDYLLSIFAVELFTCLDKSNNMISYYLFMAVNVHFSRDLFIWRNNVPGKRVAFHALGPSFM